MKTVSVVINARLQSTRVPQKLVRPFAGTSLLKIALAKLDKMNFFDARYLAVADNELIPYAEPFKNVKILQRDKEAVQKGVNPQTVTFAHYLKIPSDYIFVFNPCLPLITVDSIKKAYDYFQSTSHQSYTSCVPTRDWIFDDNGNALTNADQQNVTTSKGRIFYKAAHAFHIVNKEFFRKNGYHWTFTPNDPHLVPISEEEFVDVDTEIEFQFAEFCYKAKVLNS